MDIPVKTLKNGFRLPVYGLGLWQVGGRNESDKSKDHEEIETIHKALELGITHLDTAESYGVGHSEEILGEAIQGYDRQKLIIATKVSAYNQTYDSLLGSFEASLKRLGTDYVDLYLLHRYPEPGIDIAETMRAMDELVEQGVVKNIGVCNLTNSRLQAVQEHTKNKIVYNQLHYNVQYREVERLGILEFCQENDILLDAWRPVQKGSLPKADIIVELAKKYGKTETQVVINWLISQPNVVTIPKTSNINHLKENLGAVDWLMEPEDIERIRREFPDQEFVSDAVPLSYTADVEP